MKALLRKAKNWLLVIVMIVAGVAEFFTEIIPTLAAEFDLPGWLPKVVRAAGIVAALILAKLQPPTQNPEKLDALARKARIAKRRAVAQKRKDATEA